MRGPNASFDVQCGHLLTVYSDRSCQVLARCCERLLAREPGLIVAAIWEHAEIWRLRIILYEIPLYVLRADNGYTAAMCTSSFIEAPDLYKANVNAEADKALTSI